MPRVSGGRGRVVVGDGASDRKQPHGRGGREARDDGDTRAVPALRAAAPPGRGTPEPQTAPDASVGSDGRAEPAAAAGRGRGDAASADGAVATSSRRAARRSRGWRSGRCARPSRSRSSAPTSSAGAAGARGPRAQPRAAGRGAEAAQSGCSGASSSGSRGCRAAQAKQLLLAEVEQEARHQAGLTLQRDRGGDQARGRAPRAQHPLGRDAAARRRRTPARRRRAWSSCRTTR